jgi:hypothetical protein
LAPASAATVRPRIDIVRVKIMMSLRISLCPLFCSVNGYNRSLPERHGRRWTG